MDLCGSPVIEHVVNRLKQSTLIDEIIIATSTNSNNQPLIDFCIENDISYFVGSEDDVLDRYYQTAVSYNIKDEDIVIRITSDCPLIDPFVVDKVIEEHISNNDDYTTNVIECTYPDGLDCEVFNFSVLKDTWLNANLSSQREHVTLYIRDNPDKFKLGIAGQPIQRRIQISLSAQVYDLVILQELAQGRADCLIHSHGPQASADDQEYRFTLRKAAEGQAPLPAAAKKLLPDRRSGEDRFVRRQVIHGFGEIAANLPGGREADLVCQAGCHIGFMDNDRDLQAFCCQDYRHSYKATL